MFILEEPYVSTLLADTAAGLGVPVLDTPMARKALGGRVHLSSDASFETALRMACGWRLYANSENAIGWIAEHLAGTALPERIAVFKDKVAFRELVADLYPDYRFAGVDLADLHGLDPTTVRAPFVVKPAVGFFSAGVHVVGAADEWPSVVERIEREVEAWRGAYPEQVLGLERFVVEEVIEGEEFAIDAYFDAAGEPVLVNVYAHLFASERDVSDRVYYTSVETVESMREPALAFLREIGERAKLRDFPVHVELRVDAAGAVAPIEVNPMRFGGWCATDLAHFAYGVNPYTAYLRDEAPDWERIAAERAGQVTALVIADVPATTDLASIASVDYEGFAARFSEVLELRPTDFNRFPVFAFTFVRAPGGDMSELRAILGEDLTCHLRFA